MNLVEIIIVNLSINLARLTKRNSIYFDSAVAETSDVYMYIRITGMTREAHVKFHVFASCINFNILNTF